MAKLAAHAVNAAGRKAASTIDAAGSKQNAKALIVREISCLCSAREDDHGQQQPRQCWNCGRVEMRRPHAQLGVRDFWEVG